jgi:Carboxypeptidase regulatory-like domain
VSRFAVLFVFSALGLFAQQVEDAVVVGSVFDPANAAVSSAAVTLTHLATGARIQVHTGDRGEYRTPPLRIGEYTISIEAAGFKRFNQRGIVLDIGDVRQVDAVLEVGQVSDSVNVEASAPLLQTSDATVGTVIGNQQITNLPLNGRDYLQLAALSSGTIPSTNVAWNGAQVGVSMGGQAGTAAAFLLDGLDNNTQTILLLRNEALDAKNLFATFKSPFKRNQFGAAAGGPIIKKSPAHVARRSHSPMSRLRDFRARGRERVSLDSLG